MDKYYMARMTSVEQPETLCQLNPTSQETLCPLNPTSQARFVGGCHSVTTPLPLPCGGSPSATCWRQIASHRLFAGRDLRYAAGEYHGDRPSPVITWREVLNAGGGPRAAWLQHLPRALSYCVGRALR